MKTKTNSIFIALLSFLLGLFASSSPCNCPGDISHSISTAVFIIVEAGMLENTICGDICFDCGHSKNCGHSHKKSPAVASAANVAIVDCNDIVASTSLGTNFSVRFFSKEEMGAVGNRAPPWTVKPTLQSLHQQLLV